MRRFRHGYLNVAVNLYDLLFLVSIVFTSVPGKNDLTGGRLGAGVLNLETVLFTATGLLGFAWRQSAPRADSALWGGRMPLRQLAPHLCPGTRHFSTWNPRSSESCHVAALSSWTSARRAGASTRLGCFFKNSFCELIKLIYHRLWSSVSVIVPIPQWPGLQEGLDTCPTV